MSDHILVTIQDGTLSGVVEKTVDDREFFSFMGIPFAKPPLGDLKFKAPQPIEPWEGIFVANQPEHPCLAKDMLQNKIIGDFDCLYLNVYTPQLPKNDEMPVSKPVMIMIHGGGFTSGSNSKMFYDCQYFMDKDVVLVVINYRLGVLGFLSLKDEKLGVSGNAALKDQTLALKWVQKNISAFGGDPNNVTLFGESAGGASVSFHMLSPMSKGLFHKVIIQSGVATSFWAEGDVDLAKELLNAAGKTASSEAEMLQIFENLSKEELIAAQLKVPDIWKPSHHRYIGPTVETSTTEENFLPDSPINILKSGKYNKVPAIIGVTTNEGLIMNFLTTLEGEDYRPVNDAEYCPYSLHISGDKALQIGKQIKDYYYGDKEINDKNMQCYYNFVADTFFLRSTFAYVDDVLKTSNSDVYLYNFDLITNLNVFKAMFKLNDSPGVCHGEDLVYLFKTMMSPPVEKNSEEYLAIQRVTTWWTNFAKYSNPNGPSSNNVDSLLEIIWPSADVKDLKYLNIANRSTVQSNYGREVAKFWDSIEAQC